MGLLISHKAAPDAETGEISVIDVGAKVAPEHIGRCTQTGPLQSSLGEIPATGRPFALRVAELGL